ncbi:glycine-rich RNA-binding protein 3, mitochondrial-like [Solanum tuberosum]|uniref:Nucleolin n=1 Tax=Solanum tuberosum TaxID=4113 RepID=M1BZ11_SOLTU|nr:PREDICTED: glycine-rich RNA-binding protein 3, mitochondrial-like [Solanum tuberosum]
MALRAAAAGRIPVAPRGLRAVFYSFSANVPLYQPRTRPPPEPSTNLYVSGLSRHTTSESLRNAFAEYGEVLDARVLTDGITGYSTCCGYVRYQTMEESAAGLEAMDGQFLDGLVIVAEYAKPKPRHLALEDDYPAGGYGLASVLDMSI